MARLKDADSTMNKAVCHLRLTEKADGVGRGRTRNWIIEDLKSWSSGWKVSAEQEVQDAIDQKLIIKTGSQDELYNDLWVVNPNKIHSDA